MRERILVLRDRVLEENDPAAPELRRSVEIPARAAGLDRRPERIFTVNGAYGHRSPSLRENGNSGES